MAIDVALLSRVCEAPGAPGFEKLIRELVLTRSSRVSPTRSRVDNMGNVVALKKGRSSAKKLRHGRRAHGRDRLHRHPRRRQGLRPLQSRSAASTPKTLTAQRVIVHGKKDLLGVMGSKPTHIMQPEERTKPAKITDYFIDTGLPKKEVAKYVEVGNPVTRWSPLLELGECVNVKSLDNRVCVFLLIEALKSLKKSRKKPAYDFYAVFTVQEEVGLRGANVSALDIKPDFGFGLDTTIAYDVPGSTPQERCTALGEGAGIKIMDSSVICDYRMVAFMKKTADKYKIKWQPEILAAGGTDTASLQRMVPGGSIAGAVSVPTRHIHQTIETVHKKDLQASIDLLVACVCELDKGDWQF
jgi:tetrahedral aminopeptidase